MQYQFDASGIEPTMGMAAWPAGWHDVILTDLTPRENQKKTGGLLMCLVQGISGPVQGLNHPIVLNLWNESAQAKEIANKELSAIVHVTLGANQGRLNFASTDELKNIPFKVLVRADSDDASRSRIVGYADVRGNDPKGKPAVQGGGPSFVQPGPSAAPAAPWQGGQQPPAQQGFQPPTAAPAPATPAWAPQQPQQPQQPQFQPPMAQQPVQQYQQPPAQPPQGQWTPPGGGAAPAASAAPPWMR